MAAAVPESPLFGWLQRQSYLVGYGAIISTVSPVLNAHQLCKVYRKPAPLAKLGRLSLRIFPHQVCLKWAQMNAATPVKEHMNTWIAFAVVGILQGGVYGQSSVHFSRALSLSSNASLKGMFRGVAFAASRDCLSQGIPFALSPVVQRQIIDPMLAPSGVASPGSDSSDALRRGLAVFSTSIAGTVLSQGCHNCQIKMQADQSLSYSRTVQTLWKEHGMRFLHVGASARIGLLLVVNVLNEVLLRRAWS